MFGLSEFKNKNLKIKKCIDKLKFLIKVFNFFLINLIKLCKRKLINSMYNKHINLWKIKSMK